jgi:hypothetical protein
VAGLVAGVVLTPWIVRNSIVVGSPVLSSDGGRALWVGNNEWTLAIYPEDSIDKAENKAFRELPDDFRKRILERKDDEVGQSALYRERAMDYIRSDPGAFAHRALVKTGALLSPRLNPPSKGHAELKGLVYALSYLPALAAGLPGFFLLRRRWRRWLFAPALLLGFLAPAAVLWGQTRHRTPLDFVLIVGSATLLAALLGRLRARRPREGEA